MKFEKNMLKMAKTVEGTIDNYVIIQDNMKTSFGG